MGFDIYGPFRRPSDSDKDPREAEGRPRRRVRAVRQRGGLPSPPQAGGDPAVPISCWCRSIILFPKVAGYSSRPAQPPSAEETGLAPLPAPAIIPLERFRRWDGSSPCTGHYCENKVAQPVYQPRYQVVHGFRALSGRRGISETAGESASWYKKRHSI